jgi:hypothetical protein
MRELKAYKQTEAYKIFTQKQSEKKQHEDKPVQAAVQPIEVQTVVTKLSILVLQKLTCKL